VIIEDTLPTETVFVSASPPGTYDSNNHTVTWQIATLPFGPPEQCLKLVVRVKSLPSERFILNYATFQSNEYPRTTFGTQTLVLSAPGLEGTNLLLLE